MKNLPIDFEDLANLQYCNAWVATAIVGSAVIGAATTAFTASKAAEAQTAATERASNTQLSLGRESNKLLQEQYDTTRKDLEPYRIAGAKNLEELQQRLPFLTSPIEMTQENLEKTPGYQFTKTQGLKATQNSVAARGLGVSGAALKGAAAFTTGLANQTYKDQFALENINRTNAFERLMALVTTGGNAAAQTSKIGADIAAKQAGVNTTVGGQVGANMVGAGNAQAGAWTATGNAFGKAAGDLSGFAMYKGLYGNKSGGNSGSSTWLPDPSNPWGGTA
jgi:hypothetical protein